LSAHVHNCSASSCNFNRDATCHASAIAVGPEHPLCDLFTETMTAMQVEATEAPITLCSVMECSHNQQMNCMAPAIDVGMHDGHADCTTFARG